MQKKITALTLAIVLAFSLAASAFAAAPRWGSTTGCTTKLTFSGTTATCNLNVRALSGSDISATLTLYEVEGSGVTYVTSWDLGGTNSLNTSRTASVSRGQEYLLTADVVVDGPGGRDHIYKSSQSTCG